MTATFNNHGKLRLNVSALKNLADSKATYMIATGVIPEDKTIVGNLYDASDKLVARKRVYCYKGPQKNSPFGLSTDHAEYLSGKKPSLEWPKSTIQLWMEDRQTKVRKDRYHYTTETKEELLAKIEAATDLE